jgi:hypothetical protein
MAGSATSLRTAKYPAIVIRSVVVQYASRFPHPTSRLPIPLQYLFMSLVFERPPDSSDAPVHILIVVVGAYLRKSADLIGAGVFAQSIVDFWQDPERAFPDRQYLSTIEVLASDPLGPVTITSSGGPEPVSLPSHSNVKSALLDWADRIKKQNGIGFLHWVGHGSEVVRGGGVVHLSCDGPQTDAPAQSGLDWTRTLHVINAKTARQPVYCFIDACRARDLSTQEFEGIGPCDLSTPDNADVFMSASRLRKAFWVHTLNKKAADAGCEGHALGTRAFMFALKGFGARTTTGRQIPMPVPAAELVEAASALVERWARHQRISASPPEGPRGTRPRAIMMTKKPMSVVDVIAKGVSPQNSCDALEGGETQALPSETTPAPFEFRLGRKPHSFRFNGGNWDPSQDLIHPYIPLYD